MKCRSVRGQPSRKPLLFPGFLHGCYVLKTAYEIAAPLTRTVDRSVFRFCAIASGGPQIGQSECVSLCTDAVEAVASRHPLLHMWWVDGDGARHDIGRPGDNLYRLTFVTQRPHKLLIELDEQVLLILTEPKVAAPGMQVRLDFEQMTLDWQGYGDLTPHASIWSKGHLILSGQ